MFVFITSVKHPYHSFSYEKVWELLGATLASVCNQTDESFKVIVTCNRVLHDFEGMDRIHAHTEFVVLDYPPVSTRQRLTSDDKKLDVGLKYAVGLLEASKYAPDYIMFFDADDFVGNDIVEYSGSHPRENGWFIDKGYLMLGDRYSKLNNFNEHCGTSNIFSFSLMMNHMDPTRIDIEKRDTVLAHVDDYFLRFILGSHKYAPSFFEQAGTPLKPFPKRAVIWLLDHGENRGGKRGGKRKLIGRTLPLDDGLRQYFNIHGCVAEEAVPDHSISRSARLACFVRQLLSKGSKS